MFYWKLTGIRQYKKVLMREIVQFVKFSQLFRVDSFMQFDRNDFILA